MIIEVIHRDPYVIFRIKEVLDTNSNLSELHALIKEYLKRNNRYFAIGFSKNSFFYSKTIATMISIVELIKNSNGTISIIEANHDILELVSTIDSEGFISIFQTEEELLFHSVSLFKRD
jgi:anti-anti-sigma regulatory factor